MEEYVTRIGDVTIQRVIPGGAGPPVEPVRVMESEELLRAVKQEPLDDEEEEEEEDEGGEEEAQEGEDEGRELEGDKEEIRVKVEVEEEEDVADESENTQNDDKEVEEEEEKDDDEDNESSKRKADGDEDSESKAKKKKMENEGDADKKKISNLRRNIREVMDEAQLDEATLAAQRQEAERLRRVQDQQKYLREVQRQIQLNKQNSKTQSRVISLLQGGSTSLLKSSAVSSSNSSSNSSAPSTVLVKLGSGQQQALNRKTLEVLRGGKTITTVEPARPGITRVTPSNRPAMVTPSVSIAPVKPIVPEGQKKDVVTISSSSDSEDDCIVISEGEGEEEEEEDDVDTTNSGMHTNDLYNIPDEQGRVLINVGKPESEPEIYLAPQIARIIKPHQIGGVRFLFDNVVESIERFNNSTGFGCILAHSMGLGKTLQVVSFCDVFLRETSAKTVMCIMPINTLQNWVAEFNLWLPTDPTICSLAVHGEVRPRNFGIFVLNDMHKTIAARAKVVEEWNRDGGVLLIGYEMYRQLSLKRPGRLRKGKKRPPDEDVEDEKNKPLLEAMHEALVRPGPDLVICDEGHRIKNSHASISHALKQIRTKRRVVLTGYPLQNNLLEYWCMVDFVRPNYLGTKTEFSNMFERPIQNGQCIDSTPQDIRLMRYRAHVLHSLLEGFVQRRSHSVLRNTLPQKEEYVILVRMTTFQRKLYDTFMNEVVRTKAVPNPLKAFAVCCKIWNHPDILYNFIKKKELDELQDLDIEETANLHTGPNSPRRPLAPKDKKGKTVKKAQVAAIKPEVAAPPQPQITTPEVKTEERKFDFPPHPQNSSTGPPGYGGYYPPPYSDVSSYPYHRPPAPGMYYPGYYQDNPGYYSNYDSGYPGYFSNFGPYSGQKNEEFEKQSWGNNYGGNKDKNLKSPKDFEHSKPGFQEFHHIKEEKTEVKEEKQQFNCGFSGGQVSYNYRSYNDYSEYPYPTQEYQQPQPPWNKGNFSNFSQAETPPGSGSLERSAPKSGSCVTMGSDQKNTYNSNQPDSVAKLNASEDRAHSQSNQAPPHGIHERNQSNQNINESHSLHSSSDQQRLVGNQDHSGGNQNMHANHGNVQANNMVMIPDDHQRRTNQDHSSQQGLFLNQRSDNSHDVLSRNQDNLVRNRNSQEMELNRMHANSHVVSSQPSHSSHDQLQMTQQNMYGNKTQENEYRNSRNQERLPGQPMFSNFQTNKDYLISNQNLNIQSNMSDNSRVQGNQEQTLIHQSNNFSTQRAEHMMHLEHVSSVQNIQESHTRMQNPQERITGSQTLFGSQELQRSPRSMQNIHDVQHRTSGTQDHIPTSQQNVYRNQRTEHTMQGNQEHISSSQHNMFGNMRSEHGMEHVNQEQTSSKQKNVFGNQRGEHNIQVNPDNLQSSQNVYLNPRNEHSMPLNQENMQNTQQGVYGTHRNEHSLQEQLSASQHNISTNQRSENNTVNPDHLANSQKGLYGNQHRNEHSIQNNHEHITVMQQSIYNKERGENNMQLGSEQVDMFGDQRSELNIHGNAAGSQQNLFNSIRTDHGMSAPQDGLSYNQSNLGRQTENQQRHHIGSEHLAMSNQHMFSGRNEHGTPVNQEHLQQSPSGNQERDLQHRVTSQDRLSGNNQFFGTVRNELIQSSSDRRHRHQEEFSGNKNIHEIDSKLSGQNINPVSSQSMYAGQRVDQNMHSTPEESCQQNISGIQERISTDRFSGGHNMFGNQDDVFRGQNIHESQHKLQNQIPQQNIYGNQFINCSSIRGSDLQGSAQAVSSQNQHQGTKRSSNNDHMSAVQQQESFDRQGNDHSMQKIMKTDNQQKTCSVQERNPSQFNMFPNPDGQYRHCNNQEAIQNCRTNLGERQNPQESANRMHLNVDRPLGNQPQVQDQKQSNQNYFTNQSIHDQQRWIHNNQQLPDSQQNIFDNRGAISREDSFQGNQNLLGGKVFPDNQQFHSSQECGGPVSQQGMFSQSNQSNNQRQDHNMGKAQNIQENQYLMCRGQDAHMREQQQNTNNTAERQQGLHSKDSMHGSPQNVMSRKNSADHLSSQGMSNTSGMYMNQLQHNIQENRDYMLNNQCGSENISDVSGGHGSMHMAHQQSGMNMNQNHGLTGAQHISSISNQEMQKGSQSHQNYALQNPPQMHSSHETHQSSLQQNMLSNQSISRPQNSVINSQEIQQVNNNENIPGNHHSIYENQFHIQNSQQTMQCMPPQHLQGPQKNLSSNNSKAQMFGNQHLIQGTSQNIGSGMQSTQTHLQTNQQKLMSGPPTSSLIHNKDVPQGSHSIPTFSGHYQQNVPVSSHNMNIDHLHNSKLNMNSNLNVPVSQHNIQNQPNTSSSQTVPVNKNDLQKMQGSPPNISSQHKMKSNQGLSVNQQGTQTGPDHSFPMAATQHKVQNILNQGGMTSHQQSQNSFDQTIIMSSKGMSGGQMIQSSQQQKLGVQTSTGNPEEQGRFTGRFNESFMKEQFQGNYNKPGFFGQDGNYQFPYEKQFPYQDKQFNESPGPSGQQFRKDDAEEGKSKEAESNQKNRDGEEGTKMTSNSSTNTERDEERDKREKKDDDDKVEKKEIVLKSNKEDPGIPYDWATEFLKGYTPGDIGASAKMAVFFCILEESIALGDRILVFSQSLFTLNLMEELLQQQLIPGREDEKWVRNINYYRLDGSTTAMEREKLINEFNSNSNLHLFLVSTRAGSLGINLVGANRVIVFDASWNPCHDTQAVCRVYRYGQKKPCFVYRLVTDNCLEKKIYDRQINKQGMSDRVVDECNPDAHLSIKEVTSLCWDDKTDDDGPKDFSSLQDSYIDVVLQKVIQKHSSLLSKEPFQHESLLVDRKEKKLSQAEKRLAKRSYELEKQATTRPVYNGVQMNQPRPKPMASVRPMQAEMGQTRQRGWIPASVWQRQGMSAQEMTLPLDVVIPTNAADRASIVLKAGQKVMVLKSPKGIYMQLENGKIIAIRTAFKVGAKKPGEQQPGKGNEIGRKTGRQQMISPRGRPVRAVGPVSRPPPVTVTVTRKRPTEEEPSVRRDEDSTSTAPPVTATISPMDVQGTEKDVPNPFTAAAAASLSSKQLNLSSASQQTNQPPQQSAQVQNMQNQNQQQDVQQAVPQAQHPSVPQPQHSHQMVAQPPHGQQSLTQSKTVPSTQFLQQQPIQQPVAQQPVLHQPISQQVVQHQQPMHLSHLSQPQPLSSPQQSHQPHLQHLPHQQLQQPISHLLPSQPIPPHSQLPSQSAHPQQTVSLSPLPQQTISHPQISKQPIAHSQLTSQPHQHSQQSLLSQSQLPLHSIPHSQMQSLPILPLPKMHHSVPIHPQISPQAVQPHTQLPSQPIPHVLSQQSLSQPQLPQQSMLHPQVQHPQHYEPPPIPPLVGDQLT
ncbi:uncharacterized protein [Halyomorpha halys]|uniref:uncharacterized protein isoform X2 n=1 Tax=Halyomorpha halys TaxID=286706 RepID=UPI0006D4DB4B|nr:uncharacterized protein LOC106685653 isoform X2 [Halyomorpha halys]